MTLMNSTVSDNTGSADSAGILNSQKAAGAPRNTLTVVNSTISGNGGRGLWNGGTLTVINTTISGNTYSGHGAGIYNFSCCGNENATATVINSTITGNNSSSKSGIWNNKTIRVSNTIIAGNTAPSQPDCNSLTSLDHNLVGNSSGCSFTAITGDKSNLDPKLGPLADNGDPTKTHALLPGSPAIDAGSPAAPGSGGNACQSTDQRGVKRPVDGDHDGVARCDSGAFELVPPVRVPATIVVTKTGATGATCFATDCSLREAIKLAQSGDKIVVPRGIYTLTLGRELAVNTGGLTNTLTITGAGSSNTIIQASASSADATSRVFNMTGGTVVISGVTIRHGNTTSNGGGIQNSGTLTLTDSTVSGNTAATNHGGGIWNNLGITLILTGSTVSGNTAHLSSGGIISDGTLILTDSTVSGNAANSNDGGISNSGTLTLTDSTVSGNTASKGGGIFDNRTLTVTGSTINSNVASGNGGGIYNEAGVIRLTNSTISGNKAILGGGVYDLVTVFADYVTVAFNEGGGLHLQTSTTASLHASAIWSLSGPSCSGTGTFISLGHNLDSDGTCGLNLGSGDLPSSDPKLGPLADNGGPTLTRALLPGSPAIDVIPAQDCVVSTDQRGAFRPQGVACDIGAYEHAVTGDADGDGVVHFADLRIVGADLGGLGRGDLNLDGVIDVLDLVLAAINLVRTGT